MGLAAARKTNTPMPVTAATRELVQNLIGLGYADKDFATLIFQQAQELGPSTSSPKTCRWMTGWAERRPPHIAILTCHFTAANSAM